MQISYCTKQILAVVFLSVHIVKTRQAQSFILCYIYIYIYIYIFTEFSITLIQRACIFESLKNHGLGSWVLKSFESSKVLYPGTSRVLGPYFPVCHQDNTEMSRSASEKLLFFKSTIYLLLCILFAVLI